MNEGCGTKRKQLSSLHVTYVILGAVACTHLLWGSKMRAVLQVIKLSLQMTIFWEDGFLV